MVSASISTQLQVMKLQLFGATTMQSGFLMGYEADVPAGESIAIMIQASTAAVLNNIVIAGNLY
jgi:hypothetical protein